MNIEIDVQMKDVYRSLNQTRREKMPKATARAINKAIAKVNTRAKQSLSAHMGIKQKGIKGKLTIRKASYRKPIGTLIGSGRGIGLIHFNRTRQTKKGVVSNAYGRKRVYPGTFVTTVGAGSKGVFTRKGQPSLPIKKLYGPTVAKTMAESHIQRQMSKIGADAFDAELQRQLNLLHR